MRIVIVDDSRVTRIILEKLLRADGHEDLQMVGSAEELFRLLQAAPPGEPPPVDLILLDVMMPGISGYEACRQIRSQPDLARLPIIMVTACRDPENIAEAFAAGANDYVGKPVERLELLARVRSVLGLKREMDERLRREAELIRLRDELSAKNTRLADLLRNLQHDLTTAGEIQRALLPPPRARLGRVEATWRFEPCLEVGGDLLNFIPLGRDRTAFYLLDVCGHGVSSALLSVAFSNLLATWALEDGSLTDGAPRSPAEVTERLNRHFFRHWQDLLTAPPYVTLIYGVVDTGLGLVRWTRAGHPFPLFLPADAPPEFGVGGEAPVGFDPDTRYPESTQRWRPGDRLFLYSDGLVEEGAGCGKPAWFDDQALVDVVTAGRGESLEAVVDEVMRTWTARRGGPPRRPRDDVSLLALEFSS